MWPNPQKAHILWTLRGRRLMAVWGLLLRKINEAELLSNEVPRQCLLVRMIWLPNVDNRALGMILLLVVDANCTCKLDFGDYLIKIPNTLTVHLDIIFVKNCVFVIVRKWEHEIKFAREIYTSFFNVETLYVGRWRIPWVQASRIFHYFSKK